MKQDAKRPAEYLAARGDGFRKLLNPQLTRALPNCGGFDGRSYRRYSREPVVATLEPNVVYTISTQSCTTTQTGVGRQGRPRRLSGKLVLHVLASGAE